jgi:hypothetical protein
MALRLLAVGIGWMLPAFAHHSGASYDFKQIRQVSGTVKDVRVINPHMSITLAVTDTKGTRDVAFEGHSVNNFYRVGWRPGMIKVGDRIKVTFAPRKDGADGGFVTGFITAQGRTIAFEVPGAPPPGKSAAPAAAPAGGK